MKKLVMGMLGVGIGLWSSGSCAEDLRQQMVASTLVTGTVLVSPDGKVHSFKVDQAEKLPAAARDLLNRNIPTWTFERNVALPVDITERMTIRLMAKAVDAHHDAISIVSASFDDDFRAADETVVPATRTEPKYPGEAVTGNVNGTVYTLIYVGRDGRTQKALAEQVNLRTAVPKKYQDQFRKDLANAATSALSSWTWRVPTSGRQAAAPGWWVRIPVVFTLSIKGKLEIKDPEYGDWDVYIPGPRLQLTLDSADQALQAQGSDAIANGTIHLADPSVKLTTSLGGS
ncbi:hypothetical protein [Dyella japonica]|uniref:Energy transducer TonB n=1 Tax=Dyella japonica A8 TaxID=1217721 RepID=A0A075K3R2_9GAMM|nr:hypothetical protein [Dyella japonica]AIF48851.1 hypothetical protein HY57_17190 [Dyella japonica A8]